MYIINKLILNEDYTNNPHKSLVDALNVVYDKSFNYLINENGYSKIHTFNHQICGVIATPKFDIVFTTNNSSICRIYKVNDTTKTLILQGNFKFHTNYTITGVYDYNNNGDLIVAWTDTINPIGILNIDNYLLYNGSNILPDSYIDTIYLFPNISIPLYNLDKIRSGGNIKKAAYYFIINYYINDYDLSNWLLPSHPIYIFDVDPLNKQKYIAYDIENETFNDTNYESINESYQSVQTTDTEYSNKSIILNISNLDTRYSKFKVAIIQKLDTSVTVYDIGDYLINGTSSIITYDGTHISELSLSEVTVPFVSYKSAETITKLNGRLLLANLKSTLTNSYQKYANNIRVTYDIETLIPNAKGITKDIYNYYDVEENCFYLKSVMPDEVYALYIGLIGKDGTSKGNYHIPGRHSRNITSVNGITLPALTSENTQINDLSLRGLFPQKYNDIDSSIKLFHLFDTADNRSTSTPATATFNINTIDVSSIAGTKGECIVALDDLLDSAGTLSFTFNKDAFILGSEDIVYCVGTTTLDFVTNINANTVNTGYTAEYIDDYAFKVLAPLSYGSNSNLITTNVIYTPLNPSTKNVYIQFDFSANNTATDTIGVDTGSSINVYITGQLIGSYIILPNDTKQIIHTKLSESINSINLYTSSVISDKVVIYPDILLGPDVINNINYKLSATNNSNVTFTYLNNGYFTGGVYNNYLGRLSYWENKDELYPNTDDFDIWDVDVNGNGFQVTTGDDLVLGVGTLKNKNVRHHKIPSHNYIYNNGDTINKIINLKIYNIKFPQDILDDIQGFTIMYAARNTSNMTVIGTCPLIRNNFYGNNVTDTYIRFNDFGLVNQNIALGKSYIKTIYKELPKVNPLNSTTVYFYKVDTLQFDIHTIKSAKYIPNDNSASTPDNLGREACLMLELDYAYLDSDVTSKVISNLCIYNPNPYNSFYRQTLCIAGNINLISDNVYSYSISRLKGFDTYLNTQLMRMYRGNQQILTTDEGFTRYNGDGDGVGDNGDETSVFNEFSYPSYSIFNIPTKIVDGIVLSSGSSDNGFFKTTRLMYQSNFSINPSVPDNIIYNLYYSAVNNIKVLSPYNPNNVFVDSHPNRIHRSAVQSKESLVSNWRYLSALEYYETVKDKGEILNIQGSDNLLLIHCIYSLFIAKLKDKLEYGKDEIYLGQADIFDREPQELKPSESAYTGLQSRLSAKLTDVGYCFYNPYTKSIYIYSNEGFIIVNDQTNNGFINQLFDNSELVKSMYNNHILFGQDTDNKRLFMTNKGANNKTLSFSFASKDMGFISKHTPIPILYFNSVKGSYCIDPTGYNIYKLNTGGKGVYFTSTVNESYIDVLFNKPTGDKQLQSLSVITSNDNSNKLNKLIVYSDNQCSREYDIEEFASITDFDKIRYNKGRWYYNLIRDYSTNDIIQSIIKDFELDLSVIDEDKQWFELSMIEGSYCIVRLISVNESDIIFKDIECDFINI